MLRWESKERGWFWVNHEFGYIEKIMGEFALVEWMSPISKERGRYSTLEAAHAAAEIIYSTRSES